jgi:hypothetical protein
MLHLRDEPAKGRAMAYLDPASVFSSVGGATPLEAATAAETPGFSALEWTVIALARRDALSSLSTPGPIARALGSLFGLERRSILADPRLEALRRLAVHAWHKGYTLPVSEVKRFLSAGFSSAQLESLLASVAVKRTARQVRLAA